MVCRGRTYAEAVNQCSDALGDIYTVPYACNIAGTAGDSARSNLCKQMSGSEREWDGGRGGGCKYKAGQSTLSQCTSGGGISGSKTNCRRMAFLGDEFACCKQNYDSSRNNNDCFTKSGSSTYTCAPEFRGYTGTGCRSRAIDFTLYGSNSGNINPTAEDAYPTGGWTTLYWKEDSDMGCRYLEVNYRMAIATDLRGIEVTPAEATGAMDFCRNLFSELFIKYLSIDGVRIVPQGEEGYTPFQDRILELAVLYPSAAQPYLRNVLCPEFTRSDISLDNLPLLRFCGCHLPSNQYETSSNLIGGVVQACDPVCNVAGAVRYVDASYEPVICEIGVCIMDNITIQIAESQVGGGVSLQQMCSNCAKGCNCVISNLDILALNSTIGQDVNIEQECDSVACYQDDDDGIPRQVGCDQTQEQKNAEARRIGILENEKIQSITEKRYFRYALIFVGVLVVLLILLAFINIVRNRSSSSSGDTGDTGNSGDSGGVNNT